jgi:general secretion pathway protein G
LEATTFRQNGWIHPDRNHVGGGHHHRTDGIGHLYADGKSGVCKEQRARGDLQAIITQVRMYEMKNGGVPLAQSAGLQALVGTGKGFEELPKDPWGQEYKYKVDASSAKGFRVYSTGPDRKDDGGKGDDISSK